MKLNKYLSFLKQMLIKLASVHWPLWWVVLPFLLFYAEQLAAFVNQCSITC